MICDQCDGQGYWWPSRYEEWPCPKCKRTGTLPDLEQDKPIVDEPIIDEPLTEENQ